MLHVAEGLLVPDNCHGDVCLFVSIDMVLSASVLHAKMFEPFHPGSDRQSWVDHVKISSQESPLLKFGMSPMQEAQQHHKVHNA
jgi:hypothetical protein